MATKAKEPLVNIDPELMGGTPVFMGTRVPIQALVDYVAAGDSIEVFLDGFPSVTRGQVLRFLDEGASLLIETAQADK